MAVSCSDGSRIGVRDDLLGGGEVTESGVWDDYGETGLMSLVGLKWHNLARE